MGDAPGHCLGQGARELAGGPRGVGPEAGEEGVDEERVARCLFLDLGGQGTQPVVQVPAGGRGEQLTHRLDPEPGQLQVVAGDSPPVELLGQGGERLVVVG